MLKNRRTDQGERRKKGNKTKREEKRREALQDSIPNHLIRNPDLQSRRRRPAGVCSPIADTFAEPIYNKMGLANIIEHDAITTRIRNKEEEEEEKSSLYSLLAVSA